MRLLPTKDGGKFTPCGAGDINAHTSAVVPSHTGNFSDPTAGGIFCAYMVGNTERIRPIKSRPRERRGYESAVSLKNPLGK